jgi:hypothetical protein
VHSAERFREPPGPPAGGSKLVHRALRIEHCAMLWFVLRSTIPLAILLCALPCGFAQTPETNQPDAVRVRVSLNTDGSRTTYEFDNAHRKATATTTAPDGRLLGRIRYELDDASRFSSGIIFGPDDKFRFKSLYKYDDAGRLAQETHLRKDDSVINKLVYSYNQAGKLAGYSVYDASGKLMASSTTPTPTPKPFNRVIR